MGAALGLLTGLACDLFPLGGEVPASSGTDAGVIKLRVRNLSGLPINVEAIFTAADEQTRFTQRYLPPTGPSSIAEGVWTLAKTITVRAKVASEATMSEAALVQVGDLLSARVFRFGRDFSGGEILDFDILAPESPAGEIIDCNHNGISDALDLSGGTSDDCDSNAVPDECQEDADSDSFIDPCDECPNDSHKQVPGVCGCGQAESNDDDGDGTTDCLDTCTDTDSDGFGDPGYPANTCSEDGCPNDPLKHEPGICGCGNVDDVTDSDSDGVPDCADLCPGEDDQVDCNSNGIPDACEVPPAGTGSDCNSNGVPDDCESDDCNTNGIADLCELDGHDCNHNAVLDECEMADGAPDCNTNGLPDDCDLLGEFPEQEAAKLVADDAAPFDRFAWSLDVDCNTLLVGAYADDGPAGEDQGSAYVFVRDGTHWCQQARLVPSDAVTGAQFGFAVALEGNIAAIGARFDDDEKGAVYLFERHGTTWCERAKLTAADAESGDHLGHSVAIRCNIVVAGAINDAGEAGADQGSVYVFKKDEWGWCQEAKLVPCDAAAGDRFGWSVAVEGNRLVSGAYKADGEAGADQGAAYVFARDGSNWCEEAKLSPCDAGAGDNFGFSAALCGETAIIGAYADDGPAGANQGSAYVFDRCGANWNEQAKLVAPDAASNDFFGSSVSLSGNLAVVSTGLDNGPAGADQGSAYLFARFGENWADVTKFTASDAALGDQFGHVAALSGHTLAVGAYADDGPAGVDQGSAYIFDLPDNDCNSNGVPDECETVVGDRVYWTTSAGEVASAKFDGSDLRTHAASWSAGIDLDFDPTNRLIHWINDNQETRRSNLLGCQMELLPSPSPALVSVDVEPSISAIFWMARDDNGGSGTPIITITSGESDGSNQATAYSTFESDVPVDLVADPVAGVFYWAQNGETGTIQKVDFDGYNAGEFLSELLHINGLALDGQNGKVYWTLQGLGPPHQIRRSSLGSPFGETLFSVNDPPDKIAIDIAGQKIYWTVPSLNTIMRANADGTGTPEVFLDNLPDLTNIAIRESISVGG